MENMPVKYQLVEKTSGAANKIAKPVGIALGIAILGFAAKKFIYDPWRKKKTEEEAAGDINVSTAMQLHDAVKTWFGGSSTILNIARQGMDFVKVSTAYKKLSGKSLNDDISSKLNQNDYATWLTLVKENKAAPAATTATADASSYTSQADKGKMVLITNSTKAWTPTSIKNYPLGSKKSLQKYDVIYGAALGQYITIRVSFFKSINFAVVAVRVGTSNEAILINKDDIMLVSADNYASTYKSTYNHVIKFTTSDLK